MTKTKAPVNNQYHHGDLYQSLLTTAVDMISEGGVAALSMRKLADKVGVSRTAPYHHFKDKNELLCAIAEQGFSHQETTVGRLRQQVAGQSLRQQFENYVSTYISFAHENSEQYDLMFGREIWKNGSPTTTLKTTSRQSFQRWLEWVELLQQHGVLPNQDSALRVAQVSWATLHGLCRLLNDGIYTETSNISEMTRTAVNTLLKNDK